MSLNPEGGVVLHLGGEAFRLHMGMSALAAVQARWPVEFNDLVAGRLAPGELPSFDVMHALFTEALRRHHADRADDRWFVDDLIAANANALDKLMAAATPARDDQGKPKAARKSPPRR